ELLLICERASASGQAFVAALNASAASSDQPNAQFRFAEHHMTLTDERLITTIIQRAQADSPPQFRVREATMADLDALTAITASAFGEPLDSTQRRITQDFLSGERWLIGLLGDEALGSLRATPMSTAADTKEREAGIYGFGVLRTRQGQGWGRRTLAQTLAMLRDEGYARFSLEVETNNEAAFALYRSCGFVMATTYEYYALT
ncbi:MAG TPA: N-acetyltransferase, partial [Ktedonobacterales bacterium]|nr:N-acetyltransferase [Ktedonobacterales bacterium]